MTLLHETPEMVPTFGQWVCDCRPCLIAVRADAASSAPHHYIVKCEMGRERVSARQLARYMAEDTLDSVAERAGLGYVREVLVAEEVTA